MRKPLEFLACVPVPWMLYRFTEHHRNYPDAIVIAGAAPLIYAAASGVLRACVDRLQKAALIGALLAYALGAAMEAAGIWTLWSSAWSITMGLLFLSSLATGRPVLSSLFPSVSPASSYRPAAILTVAWGLAFLFEAWWRMWSRSEWPFEHFLAAVPAVSYLVILGLIAWSFWYTDKFDEPGARS